MRRKMKRGRRALVAASAAVGLLLAPGIANAGMQPGQLDPGDTLYPGDSITSPSGEWSLEMQFDGNLVLYSPRHIAVAQSDSDGQTEVVLQMQQDGNLVLRAIGNNPIGATATDGNPGTALQVQNDGAVVLYAPGHVPLLVIVPPAGYVSTPVPGEPLDYVDSPTPGVKADPGKVGGDSGEAAGVGRSVGCAGAGEAVASRLPRVGPGVGAACGVASDDSGRKTDSYEVTRTLGCSLLRMFGPACDILTEDSAAY